MSSIFLLGISFNKSNAKSVLNVYLLKSPFFIINKIFIKMHNKYLIFMFFFVKILCSKCGGDIMPNMKNAKKKVKTSIKAKELNNTFKSSMKTAIKNVERAVASKDKSAASEALKVAIKRIDKAESAKVITANFKGRKKSRLTKKVNDME